MPGCSVRNCLSSKGSPGVRFFSFPKPDQTLRVLHWKLACSDNNIMEKDPSELHAHNKICSDHFDKCFMTGRYLDRTAVPSLKLFLSPAHGLGTQTEPLEDIVFNRNSSSKRYYYLSESKEVTHTQTQTTMDLTLGIPKIHKLRSLLQTKKKLIQHMNRHILALEKARNNCRECSKRKGSSTESFETKDEFEY